MASNINNVNESGENDNGRRRKRRDRGQRRKLKMAAIRKVINQQRMAIEKWLSAMA